MKKMIRSLAALTALALLGAGLIACSSDDGDGGDSVKVTPSLDKKITLKAGESGTYTVTFTVEGDTFKEPTVTEPVKLEDKNNKVTITELDMVAGSFTETSVKYTFKVTAKDNATVGTGKIAVTADASVFTGGKDYTGELDYTIEGESGDSLPNPLVYDFDEITETSDKAGATPVLDGKVVVNQTDAGKIKITANTAGTHHYIQASCGSDSPAKPGSTTGYLTVKAAKAGEEEIIFTFTTVKSTKGESNNKIVLYDAVDGQQIGISEAIVCPTSDDNTEKTLTIKATVPETFYVTFVRSAGSGGFKFSKIEQKY